MKKVSIVLLIVCFLVTLGGCSARNQSEKTSTEPAATQKVDTKPMTLKLAGGSTNGAWFMLGNGISECVNKSYPGSVTTIIPGNGVGNLMRVNKGEVNAALTNNVLTYAASKKAKPFEEKLDNLASVAVFYPNGLQIVVRKDLGITSVQDILDKKMNLRLSIDQQGSQCSGLFIDMLNAYGVTEKEYLSWGGQLINKGLEEASSMYVDGTIDGFAVLTLYPAPAIQEGDLGKGMTLLTIDPKVIDSLCKQYGYTKSIIPADAYRFTTKGTATVASKTGLTVPKNAPDEEVYKLTRALVENLDYLRNVHVALKNVTPETMVKDLGVPLHPGAEKYYKEIGVIK